MGKDSFILYLDHQDIFEMLTDEQAGQLIKNIFLYERTGQIPKMNKMMTIAFLPIMQTLDKNRWKYEEKCRKNKENIEKRWGKKDTTEYERKKSNTNCTDNDNEYDNDNEHDNEYEKEKVGDSCVDGLQPIIDFYQENIGLMTPYGIEIFSSYAEEMPQDLIIFAMQKSVEANKKSIQYIKAILNNWQTAGIKTLADAKRESKVKNKMPDQRQYDNLDFLYANSANRMEV